MIARLILPDRITQSNQIMNKPTVPDRPAEPKDALGTCVESSLIIANINSDIEPFLEAYKACYRQAFVTNYARSLIKVCQKLLKDTDVYGRLSRLTPDPSWSTFSRVGSALLTSTIPPRQHR